MKKRGKTLSSRGLWSCAYKLETVGQQRASSQTGSIQKGNATLERGHPLEVVFTQSYRLCSFAALPFCSPTPLGVANKTVGLHLQLYRSLSNNNGRYRAEKLYGLYKGAKEKTCVNSANRNNSIILQQPEISSSRSRFVNVLMSGGKRGGAYQALLKSIDTCKSKTLEKRVVVYKHTNLKDSKIASFSDNKDTTSRTQHFNPFRLHASVEQALQLRRGTTGPVLSLQSKQQTKRYLQSNQICAKTVYNVEPIVETRKVRVRGNTYQVPSILHLQRRERMAVRWIITNARLKRESIKEALFRSLGQELFDCINRQSASIQKRDQIYKLAANSRVYMRYKWW